MGRLGVAVTSILCLVGCRGPNPAFSAVADASALDPDLRALEVSAAEISPYDVKSGAEPSPADAARSDLPPGDTRPGQTTFYVATDGDDTRSCQQAKSMGTPHKSIGRAAQCFASGDRIAIRGGTYDFDGIATFIQTIPSGKSWNEATVISGFADEAVILRVKSGGCGCAFNLGSNLVKDAYIILGSMTLDGSNAEKTAVGLRLAITADHIRADRLEIRNFGGEGIYGDAQLVEIIDSDVHHNGSNDPVQAGSGIDASGRDWLVERTRVHHNAGSGLSFYATDKNDRNVVRYCQLYANGQMGFGSGLLVDGSDNKIWSNLIWGNSASGVDVYHGSLRTMLWNNTIAGNKGYGIWIGAFGPVSDTTIENTVLFGNGIDLQDDGTATTTQANLTGAGRDPRFIDAAGGNFHVSNGSPAIDQGITIPEVALDIDGLTRPQGKFYDIGAYEQ